ncbi:MAG: hypothetical protein L6U99_08545 [Clostridium sp.]|nr:MAG: hypothetical protein L6U99_08545 [Clostridium sp.]
MIRLSQLSCDDFRIYTGDDIKKFLQECYLKSFGLFSVMANKYPNIIRKKLLMIFPKCDEFF